MIDYKERPMEAEESDDGQSVIINGHSYKSKDRLVFGFVEGDYE